MIKFKELLISGRLRCRYIHPWRIIERQLHSITRILRMKSGDKDWY